MFAISFFLSSISKVSQLQLNSNLQRIDTIHLVLMNNNIVQSLSMINVIEIRWIVNSCSENNGES